MPVVQSMSGACLCGAVKFTAMKASTAVSACHCGICRKWGGGPLLAVDCEQDVFFEGGDNVGVYGSSAWAERGFCKKCGSHLFYRFKESFHYVIPVGLFDEQEDFVFNSQIFIDKKPPYYQFANKTENLTESEVFEKYAELI